MALTFTAQEGTHKLLAALAETLLAAPCCSAVIA